MKGAQFALGPILQIPEDYQILGSELATFSLPGEIDGRFVSENSFLTLTSELVEKWESRWQLDKWRVVLFETMSLAFAFVFRLAEVLILLSLKWLAHCYFAHPLKYKANVMQTSRPDWLAPFNFFLFPLLSDLGGYPAGFDRSNFNFITRTNRIAGNGNTLKASIF